MIATLILITWVLLVACVLALFIGAAERSTCDGDCMQGRHCTCSRRNDDA